MFAEERVVPDIVESHIVPIKPMQYEYNYNSELEDNIEVKFSQYTPEAGSYIIKNAQDQMTFSSHAKEFYLPNQCRGISACHVAFAAIGTFPSTSPVIIINNGVETQMSVHPSPGNSGQTAIIKSGDVLRVKILGDSAASFGLTITTSKNSHPQGDAIKWYNGELATQAVIPTHGVNNPLSDIAIYEGTPVPVEPRSYPEARTLQALLTCGGTDYPAQTLHGNSRIPQYLTIPDVRPGISCSVSVKDTESNYYGLNSHSFEVKSQSSIPKSLDFGWRGQSFAAGASIPMKVTSSSANPENFAVTVQCDSGKPFRQAIRSNTSTPQKFQIPLNLFGKNCKASLEYPKSVQKSTHFSIVPPTMFKKAPQIIRSGQLFKVHIASTKNVAIPEGAVIGLKLTYEDREVQSWNGLKLNTDEQLEVDPGLLPGLTASIRCTISITIDNIVSSLLTSVIVSLTP